MMYPIPMALLSLFFSLLVSCGILGSEDKREEDTYFDAVMNDSVWTANIRGIYRIEGDTLLAMIGMDKREKSVWPYEENLVLNVLYKPGTEEYALTGYIGMEYYYHSQSSYHESDGDVHIASYYPIHSNPGVATLTLTNAGKNRKIAEGTFEVTYVVREVDRNSPFRRKPDTLSVTNGRFRVVLEAY